MNTLEGERLKKAFVVDFDGTITKEDVGFSIVKTLAEKGWKEIGQLWLDKKIGTAECGQKQWNLIKHDDEYIRNFARNFQISSGFEEFLEAVHKEGYKVVVASDGYDVYINEILDKKEFEDLDIYCNKAVYNNGWKLSFLNKDRECNLCGNCKKSLVEELKNDDYEVYYIGDGYSDRCACIHADAVFAKSLLKEYCEEQKIPHYKFDTFFDILKYI